MCQRGPPVLNRRPPFRSRAIEPILIVDWQGLTPPSAKIASH